VRSANAQNAGTVVDFTIKVEKKACEIITCPAGEVQDAYFCGCMTEPEVVGELIDWRDETVWSRDITFFTPGDQITIRESSNSADGRTYDFELPEDLQLQCVTEVSRVDTGYWRQVVFEGSTENCRYESTRRSLVGGIPDEVITFKVYPADEPPVLGVLFDLDASVNREISVQSEGYLTIRANEAATAFGYAWETPTENVLAGLQCVDILDQNYGDMNTGYTQYLFQAKTVSQFCTDEITLTRSRAWMDENPDVCTSAATCTDVITIQVSTIVAADPTATVVSIINDDDSEEVRAAKQQCEDDDQTQWNINTDTCENKCNDANRPWYNTANQRCEAPNAASLDDALASSETQATLDLFSSFGTGGFGGFSVTTTPAVTTTTTTTTTVTSNSATQCPSGQYYSFIKKTCVASSTTAAVIPTPTITVKTEEEKLEEASSSINNAFSSFTASFGGLTDVKATESTVTVHADAKAPTLDLNSAFGFFGGDTSTQATVFTPSAPVSFEAPAAGQAAAVATSAQADSIFASMFGGGFGGFSFGF